MKYQRLSCAQALITFLDNQYLHCDGKEYKFIAGVAGIFGHGSVLGLGEALAELPHRLPFYRVQNEQGAGHMAIGFSKQRRRRQILACLSSIGPGAMNMLTAAATATANRLPALFIPGDIFANRQPDPVLQQLEQEYDASISSNDAFKPLSKYWDRISRAEQLMSAAINAMRVLSDPALCGAVTLSLPQDVAAEAFDYPQSFLEKRVHYLYRQPANEQAIRELSKRLKRAKRPLLIVGGGVRYSEAAAEIRQLAEQCSIPLVETQAGKGEIAWDHRLNLGALGTTGTQAANLAAQKSDCLLVVGSRLNDFHTASKWIFQAQPQVLSINVNRMDAYKLDSFALQADAKLALTQLLPFVQGYSSDYQSQEIAELKSSWNCEVERLYNLKTTETGKLMQTRVIGILQEKLDEQAIVVVAGGSLPSDMERLWRSKVAGNYHLEYAYSCMGYEIPGAIGAKLAEPEREVWVFIGDGTYLMYHQELLTAIAEGIKIQVVVFDNHGWQCIDNLQTSQGISRFGCELRYRNRQTGKLDGDYVQIDFAQNAASYGCQSYKVNDEDSLIAAISAAQKSDKATLISVECVVKSMSEGYHSWWNAGTPAISTNPAVEKAYQEMEKHRRQARLY